MVIKYFLITLLILSIGTYFIPVENIDKNNENSDAPIVVFEEPSMFTINEMGITRIVHANSAKRYRDRDEIYEADIALKNLDNKQKFKNENLKANLIIKKENKYTLTNNVEYTRDNFIKVNTNELFYDDIKKIADNTSTFSAIYNGHSLKGDTLYLDINNDFAKAKNTHFNINVTKKN